MTKLPHYAANDKSGDESTGKHYEAVGKRQK